MVGLKIADFTRFTEGWQLDEARFVNVADGPGLGKGDAVLLYDPQGNLAAALNYGESVLIASDGSSIVPIAGGSKEHAGVVAGGSAQNSLVWDGKSVLMPRYSTSSPLKPVEG